MEVNLTRQEVESFLFEEARLLDEGRLDEWLALFAEDCVYWLPILECDDEMEPALIYDDRARLGERVFRLNETRAYAQEPPSRTQHNISNVEIVESAGGVTHVRCNLILFEVRVGDASQLDLGRPQVLAGRCEYSLVGSPTIRIARKRVLLLTRDLPLGNLSFII